MNEVLDSKKVTSSARGRGYHYEDGSFSFHPEAGNSGTLYETVGSPLKNGSLQKTGKIYKLSVTAPINEQDPGMYMRKSFEKLIVPLEDKTTPKPLERAEVVGKTDHATVSKSEEELNVQFHFSKISVTEIIGFITKEIIEVCSIISRISTSRRGKSTPKKSTAKSHKA